MNNNIQIQAVKSVRKTWGELNPVTKRVESKKNYRRKEKFNKGWDWPWMRQTKTSGMESVGTTPLDLERGFVNLAPRNTVTNVATGAVVNLTFGKPLINYSHESHHRVNQQSSRRNHPWPSFKANFRPYYFVVTIHVPESRERSNRVWGLQSSSWNGRKTDWQIENIW